MSPERSSTTQSFLTNETPPPPYRRSVTDRAEFVFERRKHREAEIKHIAVCSLIPFLIKWP